MTTTIEYALMAGRAYLSNRAQTNQFPVPSGWTEFFHVPDPATPSCPTTSGFEAVAFKSQNDPKQIIISYAGTDGYGGNIFSNADKQVGLALGAGLWSDQLGQGAELHRNGGDDILFGDAGSDVLVGGRGDERMRRRTLAATINCFEAVNDEATHARRDAA